MLVKNSRFLLSLKRGIFGLFIFNYLNTNYLMDKTTNVRLFWAILPLCRAP